MKKTGTFLLLLGALLVLFAGALLLVEPVQAPEEEVSRQEAQEVVSLSSFAIELADTPEKREQGLSGRRDIPSRYGMLFVFPEAGRYGFWMKDMFVPIDILWLAEDGTILGIEESLSPDSYPASVYPPREVRYVLETKAGEARRSGWAVGTKLDVSNY